MDRTTRAWLLCILATSLVLNLWGISSGLPEGWHPDEIVGRAVQMARNFTLNPHEFRYGSLHFYQIVAVIVPTYIVTDLLAFPEATQKSAVYLAARALSAALATGCVALTFLAARQLFGQTVGIISALFLSITMGFVNIAHFATVDVPMIFWMMASFFMATRILNNGNREPYVLAGVFAGFAAATKYPGGMVLLSLIAVHFLQQGTRNDMMLLCGILASLVSFIAVNPVMLTSSCEFLEGFIKDAAWHSTTGDNHHVILLVLQDLYRALGLALAILVLCSSIYAGLLVCRQKYIREIVLIVCLLVPFLTLLFSAHFSSIRYTVPLIPPLLVLVGKMLNDLIFVQTAPVRYLGMVLGTLALISSAVYTVAANLEISNDSRKLAAAWIVVNAPRGSTIEASTYSVGPGAGLPEETFDLVRRPHLHSSNLTNWVAAIEKSSVYRALYPVFLSYASLAEAAGACDGNRPYYEGWYERHLGAIEESRASFDQTINGLEQRAPDFVVASSLYYDRFRDDGASPEGQFFTKLFGDASAYRKVAEIHYSALPFSWLDPEPEFVNPIIRIFQRTSGLESLSEKSG